MIEGEFNGLANKVQLVATRSLTQSRSFKVLQLVIEIAYDR
jgi:hypothetical protein